MTVAQAAELLRSGQLDGSAIAVAGFFDSVTPSCPYPGRYIGPLEIWCSFTAFTDAQADARLCEPEGSNGISCHGATGMSLSPFFMSETSGEVPGTGGTATNEPAALVLIGHGGDPRQWQCTGMTQDACAHAFVVDRIAWADGEEVPLSPPQPANHQSGQPLAAPRMTLEQVESVLQRRSTVAAAVFRAGDVATVEPRWNLAGEKLVWLVRSIPDAGQSGAAAVRPETVWLVDDASGTILDSEPLKSAASYEPARLWQMAIVHGYECCPGNLEAFSRLESSDRAVEYEGLVSQSTSGGAGFTRFGGGYGSGPLVLNAGEYTFSMWVGDYAHGVVASPMKECSAKVTLHSGDDVLFSADVAASGLCTLGPAPFPSPEF